MNKCTIYRVNSSEDMLLIDVAGCDNPYNNPDALKAMIVAKSRSRLPYMWRVSNWDHQNNSIRETVALLEEGDGLDIYTYGYYTTIRTMRASGYVLTEINRPLHNNNEQLLKESSITYI